MIKREEEIRQSKLLQVAESMMIAARTAPKARGKDNLEILVITGDDIKTLSDKMKAMYEINQQHFFLRDSENILLAEAVVLIGTRIEIAGLNCGLCGYPTCEAKDSNKQSPCMFNSHDLGIAIGSAISIAADNRVDNRVMFSVGQAAKELGYFGDNAFGFGIPLTAMGKSPFFDRPAN